MRPAKTYRTMRPLVSTALLLLLPMLTACNTGQLKAKQHFNKNRKQYDSLVEKVVQEQPTTIESLKFDASSREDAALKRFFDSFEEVHIHQDAACLELAPVDPPLPVIVWCEKAENVKTTLAWVDRGNSTAENPERFRLADDYYLIVRDWN